MATIRWTHPRPEGPTRQRAAERGILTARGARGKIGMRRCQHWEAGIRMWSCLAGKPARKILAALFLVAATLAANASARCEETYKVTLRNHEFVPAKMEVVAGQRFKLIVVNEDPTPETFDSDDFKLEKIVTANSRVTIFLGPLEAGTYSFFGELNPDTARGTMTAR